MCRAYVCLPPPVRYWAVHCWQRGLLAVCSPLRVVYNPVPLYFVPPIVPALAIMSSVGSYVPWTCFHQCEFCFWVFFFNTSLLSSITRCSRPILCISCLGSAISPRSLGYSYWRMVLETKIWVPPSGTEILCSKEFILC